MSTSPADTERPALHREAGAEHLALLRVLVYGFWAITVGFQSPVELASAPADFFSPVGAFSLLPESWWSGLRSLVVLRAIQATTVIACLAAIAGLGGVLLRGIAACGAMILHALFHSFGYYDHAQLPMLFAVIALTVSPCQDALRLGTSAPRRRHPAAYQFPLFGLAAFILACYSMIGIHRLMHGGMALFTGESFRGWILWNNLITTPVLPWFPPLLEYPLVDVALKVGFVGVTLLEAGALIGLFSTRFRMMFLVLMLGSHLAIYGIMAINFGELALLLVVLVDARWWIPRRGGWERVVNGER